MRKASHGSRGSHYFRFQKKTQTRSRNYKHIIKFYHSQQDESSLYQKQRYTYQSRDTAQQDICLSRENDLLLEQTKNKSTL